MTNSNNPSTEPKAPFTVSQIVTNQEVEKTK